MATVVVRDLDPFAIGAVFLRQTPVVKGDDAADGDEEEKEAEVGQDPQHREGCWGWGRGMGGSAPPRSS